MVRAYSLRISRIRAYPRHIPGLHTDTVSVNRRHIVLGESGIRLPNRDSKIRDSGVDLCGMAENPAPIFGDQGIEGEVEDKQHRDEQNHLDGPPLAAPLYEMSPAASSLSANLFGSLRGSVNSTCGQCVETPPAIAAPVTQHAH
jgi:hypothetical protein